jgi:hypothetical protein
MEISMVVHHVIKNRAHYNPSVPLLGVYLKESKSTYNTDNRTLTFIAALFTMTTTTSTMEAA